jgi:hypothetical protein
VDQLLGSDRFFPIFISIVNEYDNNKKKAIGQYRPSFGK